MSIEQIFSIIFSVIGGLGIFLLGMKNMSDGLQTIAGDRLRKLIGLVTNNRILAVGVGTTVTCIIQSSSITTVMVVGFVNSGLMALNQALGVIMGANIGTTITGWILVLNIGKYGLPMLGIAAIVFLFTKNEKLRFAGLTIMGIGMVFFGLELMKNGFKPIRAYPEFVQWFHTFSAGTYFGVLKCALVGCALTLIVQSSSATLGITMGLASTGVIGFETAAALVLGENIGTTITAYIASLGTTTNAKRAAYGHIVFNVSGVLWITALFPIYLKFIRAIIGAEPNTMIMLNGTETYPHIQAGIAAVHTGFNIANTILFLPLVGLMAKFLTKIVPDKPYLETPRLTHLDVLMLDSPVMGIEQSRKEIIILGNHNRTILDSLRVVLSQQKPDQDAVQRIFHHEEIIDNMQKEITAFLTELLLGNVPHSLSEEAQFQIHVADEYESMSDNQRSIVKLYLRIVNAGIEMPEIMRTELLELHDTVSEYLDLVNNAYKVNNTSIITKAKQNGDKIKHLFRDLRSRHLTRLSNTKVDPMLSTIFPDMLNCYRRVKEHIQNVAETLGGEL